MSMETFVGLGMEEVKEERKKWEEEAEDKGGVGGQDNELYAHTINLIIKKLKEINRRVIDHLISSRSRYSFDFARMMGHCATREVHVGKSSHSHKCFHVWHSFRRKY